MLKRLISRLVRKHGMIGLLMLIGDHAVKATKSKKEDVVWEEVKALLETYS